MIKFMTLNEIRERYLKFFKDKEHSIIPSAPLVPENDPSTLFTGSGMQPLITYLLGEKHPEGTRLVNSQKCFRAEDIEDVGDNRHTTFFEMLGNWSLGDYYKKEQLSWIFEFLTKEVGLDPKRLYITVFSGDEENNIPKDDESVEIWKELFEKEGIDAKVVELVTEERGGELGMQGGRIFSYNSKNWWSRAGVPNNMPAGEPGGPDSEIFYDYGTEHDKKYGEHCHPNCDCGRFVELGNSVFMEYKKNEDGTFSKMEQQNVDFGGGLERIAAASIDEQDIFKIDVLKVITDRIEELSGTSYDDPELTVSYRVVADHLRGAVFMIGCDVVPSNTEAGYFTRRLIRRAVRHMDLIGMKENTLSTIVSIIVEKYKEQYPNLGIKQEKIEEEIQEEEKKFRKTLEKGLRELEKLDLIGTIQEKGVGKKLRAFNRVDAKKAFYIFQTFGFPIEMIQEELAKKALLVDEEEFREEFKKHQELSRTASAGKFKGGLADSSQETTKLHTTAHLLLESLRRVLGDHVHQKGSNITAERLRLDFSHPEKVTDEQKAEVEKLVNDAIKKELPITCQEMTVDEAKKQGAEGVFESKYGEKVKVYSIGSGDAVFSKEICGGPHVENTSELGHFSIKKQKA
ncbi:MAG: alanine--tRNA ligase, partial [Candidatus Pacebacteria bacterium]|nr:alanine--tRNA ligase [Candidatus Paceibacterota bacterium]